MIKIIVSILFISIYSKYYSQFDWIQKGNDIIHNINSINNIDLSSDGNSIVVGSPMYEQWGDNVGLVEVYSYQNNSWNLKGQSIFGSFPGCNIGNSVRISGDGNTIALGDPGCSWPNYNQQGNVKIYKWNGSSWILNGSFTGIGWDDNLGKSIDLSFDGNTIIIGSLNGGNVGGVAKIYQYTESSWIQKGTTLPDLSGWNTFGYTVCISNNGNRVAVGMPGFISGNVNTGRVYLYEWISNDWSIIGFVNGQNYNERLGRELNMSGDGNVIAASGENNTRIFEYTGNSVQPSISLIQRGQNFTGTDELNADVVSLDNDGSNVIIGFTQEHLTKVYLWENSSWVQCGPTFTGYGRSVAINGLGTNVAISFYDPALITTNVFDICQIPEGIDNIVACDSLTWIDGITYYNSTASPQLLITGSSYICDSIAKLNLTIINTENVTIDTQYACDSLTWIDGNTYTSNNNSAIFTLLNMNGCDSTILLDLNVHNSNSSIEVMNACENYYWSNSGQTYNQSGIYSTFLTNLYGCDSIVYLNLTILEESSNDFITNGCDSISINGVTYTNSGNYIQYLTNTVGCDSLLNLNLNISNSYLLTDTIFACESYTWINGQTYVNNISGVSINLLSSEGCDSIVHLNLFLNFPSIDTTIINTTALSYLIMQGQTFTESGTYFLTLLDQFGCDSIVQLNLIIENSYLSELQSLNVSIYPNPSTDGIFNLIASNCVIKDNKSIYNAYGQFLFEQIGYDDIDLSRLSDGIYWIRLNINEQSFFVRVVKE